MNRRRTFVLRHGGAAVPAPVPGMSRSLPVRAGRAPAETLGPQPGMTSRDIVLSERRNQAVVSANVNICTTTVFYSLQFNGKNLPWTPG